jgi:hypothetical protein
MGNFIDLAGCLAPIERVRTALAGAPAASCYAEQSDRTLVLVAEARGDERFAKELARTLDVPTFSFHIHDDDLWLYEFYVGGELIDKFNTCPSYWKKLPAEEEAAWYGNADLLAKHWVDLDPESIRRYLGPRDAEASGKAYPDDEFESWDCWQLTDFLKKLGIPHPRGGEE